MSETRSRSRLAWVLVGAFAVAFASAISYYAVTYVVYQHNVPAVDELARDVRQAQELLTAREPEKALEKCSEAIRRLPEDADPQLRGYAKRVQGTAHAYLARRVDQEAHLAAAIAAFQEALEACPADQFPLSHAATQIILAMTYRDMASVREPDRYFPKSVQAFKVALGIYSKDEYPVQYARTLNDLGIVYSTMAQYGDNQENTGNASRAYAEALELLRAEEHPVLHKRILANLEATRRLLESAAPEAPQRPQP